MKEIWLDIEGYEGYQVSNLGRVKSLDRGKQSKKKKKDGTYAVYHLKGRMMKLYKGEYYRVELGYRQGGLSVHSLIAKAFIPNPKNNPCVNHIDGNKHNNNISNLEWCTYSDNQRHAFRTGLKSNHNENHSQWKISNNKVLEIRERYKNGERQCNIAKLYSVDPSTISNIVNYKYRIL